MSNALLAGAAYFVFVFFKAFQQRNVAFMHYKWVMPISYCMSLCELLVIALVAREAMHGWEGVGTMILGVGTGGGLGALASMYLHHKYIGVKKYDDNLHIKGEHHPEGGERQASVLRDAGGRGPQAGGAYPCLRGEGQDLSCVAQEAGASERWS